MPSTTDLATVRSWCGPAVGADGDDFDGDDLDERIGRLGTPEHAALEILRTMQAGMLTGGAVVFAVDGDYRQDASVNVRLLGERITQLERVCGVGSVTVTSMGRGRGR